MDQGLGMKEGIDRKGIQGTFVVMEMFYMFILMVISPLYICQNALNCTLENDELYYI